MSVPRGPNPVLSHSGLPLLAQVRVGVGELISEASQACDETPEGTVHRNE